MSTSQATMEFLLDQLAGLAGVSARKMFGEYCVYWAGKPVALVCKDQLYLKPTVAGRGLMREVVEGAPYPRAKPHWLISADLWEERDWLCQVIRVTGQELPEPRPKTKKKA